MELMIVIISQFEANHIYSKNLQEGFKKHFSGIRVILSSRKPERNKKSTTSILRPLHGRLADTSGSRLQCFLLGVRF